MRHLVLGIAVGAVAMSAFVVVACDGCASAPPHAALLPGDSGPCTTVRSQLLADGGAITTFVPCNWK